MRKLISHFDSLGDRQRLAQRIVLIGLLLIPVAGASLVVAATSVPASVRPHAAPIPIPGKKTSATGDITLPALSATTSDHTSAGTSINLSTTQASPTEKPTVDLQVNGRPVARPDRDTIHKVIQRGDTTTTLDISHSSSTTQGEAQSHTSTNISVNASSRASKTNEGP